MSRTPAAMADPMSSRCWPEVAAASSRRQVPRPTTGTLTRSRPKLRFSMLGTLARFGPPVS